MRVLIKKFTADSVFKRLILNFELAFKIIVTLRLLAYMSINSTYRQKVSYSDFYLFPKPMYNVVNESLNTNRLLALNSALNFRNYCKEPIILL